MPVIKQYTRQNMPQQLEGGRRANAADFGGDQTGMLAMAQASDEMAAATKQMAQTVQDIQIKREASKYNEKISDFQLSNIQRQKELAEQEFDPDVDLISTYEADLMERAKELEIPPSQRDQFQQDLNRMRLNFAQTGLQDQTRRAGVRAKLSYENTLTNAENIVSLDPSRFEEANVLASRAVLSLPNMSPEERSAFAEDAKDRLLGARANALIDMAPGSFIESAKGGEFENLPGLGKYLDQAKRAVETKKRERQALLQSQISGQVKDAIAEAQAKGFSDQMPKRETVIAAYGPEKGLEILEQYERAEAFGEKFLSIATLPQAEVNRILEQSVPDGEDFAQEAQEFQALQQAAASRQKAIDNDAGQYVLNNFPEVQAAYEKFNQDANPQSLQYAIDLNLEKQAELGVPFRKQRVLGKANASDVVGQLMSTKPKERLEASQGLKSQYGRHWPDVYAEMVDAGLSDNVAVMLRMESPTQRRAASLLAEADAFEDQLAKVIDKESKNTIDENIQAKLSDYLATITAQPGNASEVERTTGAVKTLAMQYVIQDKLSPAKAAQKAAKDIVTDQYSFIGRVRVPADLSRNMIEAGLEEALSLVENNENIDPNIIGSMQGTPDDIIREQYRKEIKQGGYFITNAQEDGVILFDRNGYTVMVKDGKNLKPFELKFIDIEALGRSRPAEIKSLREGF